MYYVTNQIFTDNRLNLIADRLFFYLDKEFTLKDIVSTFILTGKVSAILQEEMIGPATDFVFTTNDEAIYSFLLLHVDTFMKAKTVFKFKERILLDFEFCQLEIWFKSGTYSAINYDLTAIYKEDFNDIDRKLL